MKIILLVTKVLRIFLQLIDIQEIIKCYPFQYLVVGLGQNKESEENRSIEK